MAESGKKRSAKKKAVTEERNEHGLTMLEEAFAHEYIIDLNGLRAYKRVKPDVTEESAKVEASRLLTRVNVKARVDQLYNERLAANKITADEVLQELKLLAFQNMGDFGDWDEEGNFILKPGAEIPHRLKALIKKFEKLTQEIPQGVDKDGNEKPPQIQHKLRFELHGKEGALDKLARYFSLYAEDSNAGLTINYNIYRSGKDKPTD